MMQAKASYVFVHTQYKDVSASVDEEHFKTKMQTSDISGLMWT